MNNYKKFLKPLIIIVLVIIITALLTFGVIAYFAIKGNQYSSVTANGIAKKEVTSNKIVWDIFNVYYEEYPADLEHGYDISSTTLDIFMAKQDNFIIKDQKNFKDYLMENGIDEKDIKIGKINVSGFDRPPFIFKSIITVESTDVSLVEKIIDNMSRKVDFKANFYTLSQRYYYHLEDVVKKDLINEAIKSAQMKIENRLDMQDSDIVKIENVLPEVINIVPVKNITAISSFERDSQHYSQQDDDTSKGKVVLVAVPVIFQIISKDESTVNGKTLLPNIEEINFIPISADDHFKGSSTAPIAIIEYGDTSCPPCKSAFESLNKIMKNFGSEGQLKWIYRSLLAHESSELEARGLECASKLGGKDIFWSYLDKVYYTASANRGLIDVNNQDSSSNDGLSKKQLTKIAEEFHISSTEFDKCILLDDTIRFKVQNESYLAGKNGITGAPELIIVLDKPLSDVSFESLRAFNTAQYKYLLRNVVLISPDRMKINTKAVLDYSGMEYIFNIIFNKKQTNNLL